MLITLRVKSLLQGTAAFIPIPRVGKCSMHHDTLGMHDCAKPQLCGIQHMHANPFWLYLHPSPMQASVGLPAHACQPFGCTYAHPQCRQVLHSQLTCWTCLTAIDHEPAGLTCRHGSVESVLNSSEPISQCSRWRTHRLFGRESSNAPRYRVNTMSHPNSSKPTASGYSSRPYCTASRPIR